MLRSSSAQALRSCYLLPSPAAQWFPPPWSWYLLLISCSSLLVRVVGLSLGFGGVGAARHRTHRTAHLPIDALDAPRTRRQDPQHPQKAQKRVTVKKPSKTLGIRAIVSPMKRGRVYMDVDRDTWHQVKALAAFENQSLHAVVTKALRRYLYTYGRITRSQVSEKIVGERTRAASVGHRSTPGRLELLGVPVDSVAQGVILTAADIQAMVPLSRTPRGKPLSPRVKSA